MVVTRLGPLLLPATEDRLRLITGELLTHAQDAQPVSSSEHGMACTARHPQNTQPFHCSATPPFTFSNTFSLRPANTQNQDLCSDASTHTNGSHKAVFTAPPTPPSTARRTQPRPPPAKSKYISSGTNQESGGSGARIPFHTHEEQQSGPPPALPRLARPCPSFAKHTVDNVAASPYSRPFRTSRGHKARCG